MILQYFNSKFLKLITQIISYRQIEGVEGFRPQHEMYFKHKIMSYQMITELSLVMLRLKFIKRDKDHSYLDYIYPFAKCGALKD